MSVIGRKVYKREWIMSIVIGTNSKNNKKHCLYLYLLILYLLCSMLFQCQNENNAGITNFSLDDFSKWDTKKQVEYFNDLSQTSKFKILSEFLPGKIFYLRHIPEKLINETILLKFTTEQKLLYMEYGSSNISILSWEIKNNSFSITNSSNNINFPNKLTCSDVIAKQISIVGDNAGREIAFVFFNESSDKVLLWISREQNKKFEQCFK